MENTNKTADIVIFSHDSEKEKYELEQIIDKIGIPKICFLIADVCNEKADHVRSNWQDNNISKIWEHDANMFNNLANRLNAYLHQHI